MKTDITIIGSGVVGLAIAAEISKTNKEIVLLEQHESFGRETSSRSSEVIHAGIYYPTGSLKAQLCVEGAHILYALADAFREKVERVYSGIPGASEAEPKMR